MAQALPGQETPPDPMGDLRKFFARPNSDSVHNSYLPGWITNHQLETAIHQSIEKLLPNKVEVSFRVQLLAGYKTIASYDWTSRFGVKSSRIVARVHRTAPGQAESSLDINCRMNVRETLPDAGISIDRCVAWDNSNRAWGSEDIGLEVFIPRS